ncbi:MAG: S-layer homology domain-containing protein, partial [Coleofasciculus sp. S288]|nr:S-layer homology domain-containing protein [Coleofasciculus sp. S288]
IKVARQTWTDGCLGLGDGVCTQALVPGWQVIVAGKEKLWAYRCNESGTLVKYDEALSQTMTSRVATEVIRRREVTTRTSQRTQTVTSASGSQSTQVITGSSSSQSTQATGTTQVSGGASTTTQQQATAARSFAQVSFVDIPQGHWARDFIAELAVREIIEGFPDGKFRPNEPVTRAQFAAMVRKAFKKSKIRSAVNFRDVSTSYWAYTPIQECYEMGFLNAASGNLFRPTSSLTRLDIMVALTRGLNYSFTGSTEELLRFYSDAASVPANLRSVVATATQRGIVVNYPNVKSLSLNTVVTRAEVAAFIYQALVSTGEVAAISSPYVVGGQLGTLEFNQTGGAVDVNQTDTETRIETGGGERDRIRRNCNQGIGNGAEGCDPGNSRPHGGSNDEGGRTPGNR